MKSFLFKKFTFLIFIVFLVSDLYSQKLYLNLGVGYNLSGAPSYQISDNIETITTNNNNSYVSWVDYSLKETISFGKGYQYGGTIGLIFSKNLCVEMGISYLEGKEYEDSYVEKHTSYNDIYKQKYNSKMWRFSPTIRLSVGEGLRPYLKTGILLGLGSKITVQETFNFRDQNSEEVYQESEYDLSGGLSIGFIAGMGVCLETDTHFGFFSEINFISQSWAPKKLSYTKYLQNSIDVMSYVPTNIKEVEFVDSYNSGVPSTNVGYASERLKKYLPFSSIGFNIGIFYKL